MSADADLTAVEDVSNSEAFKILDDLVDNAEVHADVADKLKARYSQLHGAVMTAMAAEKSLLEEAKALKRQLDADERQSKAGGDSGGSAEASIDALREDVEHALSEAALAQERYQLLQLEVTDLQRQRNDLGSRMEELQAEHAAALQPIIANVRQEVVSLRNDVEEEGARAETAARELEAAQARLGQVAEDVERLSGIKSLERQNLTKVDQVPDKARRQAEAVSGVLRNVQSQLETANYKLSECESELKGCLQREKELQEEHAKVMNALERGRVQVENKERHADDIRRDVELASVEADKILADQVDLDLKLKSLAVEGKVEAEVLQRKQREKELALRAYKAADSALRELRDGLPNLRYQVEQLQRDKGALEATLKGQTKGMEEVRHELDISMNEFLKEETIGKEQAHFFQLTFKMVSLLEEELVALKREEAERDKILLDLGSQRDRVALSIAQKLAKVKEVEQSVRIKDVELAELKKIRKETLRRIRDFEKLYDLVKNQRNKFVNLIQSANQSTTEMKDKLKILTNELDILHNEVQIKDKLLNQSRSQHQAAVNERDQLRIELGKQGATFRDRQSIVDEQIAEVDKLNAIINQAEKEMLRLKKQYEVVIEARNYTGIMLIDRNDELCILHEKANIQNTVIKSGELELIRREDEIRILSLEVQELQRSIEVTKKTVPQIPLLDEDVARLQKALLEARRESEALSMALENPGNHSRWRLLEGKIPDKEELAAKIQQLEERLNDKKEALLEKELILEEISNLSDKLRSQASEGRADTLELAKRVNEYQGKLRAVTRKIMATVSELSMYQATALKLAAEKEGLEGVVAEAGTRLDQGLPPTDDAEREWLRMERERMTLEQIAAERSELAEVQEQHISDVQSSAEPRPNAYIPEQLGIPKPYGAFSPFKPTDPGATMRHIRKPQPKEIVI